MYPNLIESKMSHTKVIIKLYLKNGNRNDFLKMLSEIIQFSSYLLNATIHIFVSYLSEKNKKLDEYKINAIGIIFSQTKKYERKNIYK